VQKEDMDNIAINGVFALDLREYLFLQCGEE
jgi:hypothetical protein